MHSYDIRYVHGYAALSVQHELGLFGSSSSSTSVKRINTASLLRFRAYETKWRYPVPVFVGGILYISLLLSIQLSGTDDVHDVVGLIADALRHFLYAVNVQTSLR